MNIQNEQTAQYKPVNELKANKKWICQTLTFQCNAMQSKPIDPISKRPHNKISLRDHREWQLKMANHPVTIPSHRQFGFEALAYGLERVHILQFDGAKEAKK